MQFRCRNVNGSFNPSTMIEASQARKVSYHGPKRKNDASPQQACAQAQAQTEQMAGRFGAPRFGGLPFAGGLRDGFQAGRFSAGYSDCNGADY